MSQDEVTSIIEKIILAEAVLVPSLKGMYKKLILFILLYINMRGYWD